MSIGSELAWLFRRDLGRLSKQIEAFADDDGLWKVLPGVTNSAGNLALHLEGNLREYVGRQLGNVEYQRQRDLEFSQKGLSKSELLTRIAELAQLIPSVIESLSAEQIESEYPTVVLDAPMPTQQFLVHLYGHLNWHVGQIDYLRRILTNNGTL
jgi:hypothetical protein